MTLTAPALEDEDFVDAVLSRAACVETGLNIAERFLGGIATEGGKPVQWLYLVARAQRKTPQAINR
jgi:hypothetical protein